MLGHPPRMNLLISLIACAAAICACSTPRHTNTLIFATDTKVALDIGGDLTGGPSITLGYKRREGVFMPLLANKARADGRLVPVECISRITRESEISGGVTTIEAPGSCDAMFVGAANTPARRDAYSVLATFGGQAEGSSTDPNGPQIAAGGKLSSVFATGVAAQLLALVGGAGMAGATAPDAAAVKAAASVVDTHATETKQIEQTQATDFAEKLFANGAAVAKSRVEGVLSDPALKDLPAHLRALLRTSTAGGLEVLKRSLRNSDDIRPYLPKLLEALARAS